MTSRSRSLPHYVAVIGAAGGLGQGILRVCRAEGIGFTAIVRSRPERVTDVPRGSRIAVVTSLGDRDALTKAFSGASAVLTALGVTSRSHDGPALLSANMATVEESMRAAGVDRIVVVNTLLALPPGEPASGAMRFFSWLPGTIGRAATEQQAVVRRPRPRCVFVASLDPRPGRGQRSGVGTSARAPPRNGAAQLLVAGLV